MNRNKHFHFRLSEDEYKRLTTDSSNAGLNSSDYLRKLINKQTIKPKPPESYSKLAWEISKIGTNINQIAHKVNTAGQATDNDIDTAVLLLKKITKLMRDMR